MIYTYIYLVQSLSCVWLFATPWIAAGQASLSITSSQTDWCPSCPPSPVSCPSSHPTDGWLSRWCHPTISSSVIPFSCLQSFSAGSFQMSRLFASGGQSIGVSASASVLPMNIQDWFPLGLTSLIFLQSKGLSRVFSNNTIQKHQFFGDQFFFIVQLSYTYMTTGKIIALTRRTFFWQSNVSSF